MSPAHWDPRFTEALRAVVPSDVLLDGDTDLPAAGVNSMAIVRLVLDLESALGIAFPDDVLRPATFRCAESLWTTVAGLRTSAG